MRRSLNNQSTYTKETTMALNWDVSKVENSDELFLADGQMKSEFSTLIIGTMIVDVGQLRTEKDVQKYFDRAMQANEAAPVGRKPFVLRKFTEDGIETKAITIEQVRRLKGLTTNVYTTGKRDWNKRIKRMKKDLA